MKTNTIKRLVPGLFAAFAAICTVTAQENDREMRTRDRQTYEVIVGDYYTGRSPYFKSGGRSDAPAARSVRTAPAPAATASKPSSAPAPAATWTAPAAVAQARTPVAASGTGPCSVINSGLITMSKTMPREAVLGEPFTYELKPMATGCAGQVVVTDTIPDGATLVSTEPQASVNGNQLTWNLGDLDAGASKTLKVTVRPNREGTLQSCATVKADPRVCASTVVGKPALAIDKTGPETAQLGADVSYNVTVKNTGTAIAKGVVVTDKVPAGLGGGADRTYNVGDLGPGQSKTITVPLKAAERGRHCNVAVATSSNAGTVQDDACTVVVKPGLKLTKTGDAEQYLNKKANYRIVAQNTGDTDLHNVVVTDNAPTQTRIVSVGQGGTSSGNSASWNLGTLKPGESKTVDLVLTSTQAGRWCNAASVNSQEGLRDSSEACTLWKGIPAVLLEVVDNPDPIEIGGTTTYRIDITNQGTADLIDINTVAQFPAQFTPVSSDKGSVEGKTVRFPTVPRLAPGGKVSYTITARAVSEGDSRMKVILTESQLVAPVVEEESTRGY